MAGLGRIFEDTWPTLREDPAFDLHTEQIVGPADLSAAREFLAEHFRPRTECS